MGGARFDHAVDASGRIEGISAGSFSVRATAGGLEGTASGRVVEPAWKDVAVGLDTTCAIGGDDELYCFGQTAFVRGEWTLPLGSSSPVKVPTPELPTDVAVTWGATCFVASSGTVYCRGLNSAAQLGDGSLVARNEWEPVAIRAGTPAEDRVFVKLLAGERHFCGLTTSGAILCWGSQAAGTYQANRRASLMSEERFVDIGTGDWHACGVTEAGGLLCWGANHSYQLGDGSQEWAFSPVRVRDDRKFDAVTGGRFHTCGLADGEVFCWGSGTRGALGFHTRAGVELAPRGNGVLGIAQLDSAFFANCAVTVYGARICWGGNDHGVVGNGEISDEQEPVRDRERLWSRVEVAIQHACGLTITGELWCWGADIHGAVGSGRQLHLPEPQRVGSSYARVSGGVNHTCAIKESGKLHCWGDNRASQLGVGHAVWTPFPVGISEPAVWSSVAATGGTTCGIAPEGLHCWGMSLVGELGISDLSIAVIPSHVSLPRPDRLLAGGRHYFTYSDGEWFGWGYNGDKQLGWSSSSGSIPYRLPQIEHDGVLQSVTDVSGGARHSCAILDPGEGVVYCFGDSSDYRRGPGADTRFNQLPGAWSEVSAGHAHTCGVTSDGDVVCYGALNFTDEPSPDPIPIVGSYTNLSSRGPFTCGVDSSGTACWGANYWGNLGRAPSPVVLDPVAVEVGEPLKQVSSGTRHACGITADGVLWCWGDDSFGQTGADSARLILDPRRVER